MHGNRYPEEPYYTCNAINEVICSLNTLREQNEELLYWGRGQAERADDLEAECERLQDTVNEQEGETRDLRLLVEQAEDGEL